MNHQVSPEIFHEIRFLGEAFFLGVKLMLLYDGIRLFRCIIRHPRIIRDIEDLLFWVVSAFGICYLLFLENAGKVRMYALTGTALGMLLYYMIWGRYWKRLLKKGISFIKKSGFFRKKGC